MDVAPPETDLMAEDGSQTLLERAGIAWLETDLFGTVLTANAAACELLGVESRFLTGKPFAPFVDPQDRRRFRHLLLELEHGEGGAELEVQLRRRNEVSLHALLTVVHGPSANAGAGTLSWLVRDTTELRQTEQRLWELNAEVELRASELATEIVGERDLLHALVAHLPVGLLVIDPEGVPVVVNDRLPAILGVAIETGGPVQEGPWPEGIASDGRPYRDEDWPFARALASGERVDGERIELRRPDGSTAVVEVSSTPLLAADGSVGGAISSFLDVSARSRAERAEREFIENAAHELQTPVTAITGAVEALQLGAKSEPEARDAFLAHLERECGRLARLGAALLTLARAEAGVEQPRLELVELLPLLEELAAQLRPLPSVTVRVDCPPTLTVLTNRDLLWHSLSNLAANAVRFTSHGTIELRVREAGARRVAVEVADTGVGIPEEERGQVTTRFYRSDPRRGIGYGLGLALAEQAARAAGGRLELDSEEGRGTVVGIRLPAVRVVSEQG